MEIISDRRCHPEVFHCIVQRKGLRDILFLGQFNSHLEAESAGRCFMTDYVIQATRNESQSIGSWVESLDAPNYNGMRLRIESAGSAPMNEYVITQDHVAFRILDPSGQPYPGLISRWRELDDNDISLHHQLGTVVSEWLRVRLGGRAAAPASA